MHGGPTLYMPGTVLGIQQEQDRHELWFQGSYLMDARERDTYKVIHD